MIGDKIKELRRLNKITQSQLAGKLYVDQTAVSYWEQGKTKPDIEKQLALADIFNVTVDYLLGREDKSKTSPLDKQLEGIEFALFGEVKELTEDQKQDVLNFATFLKQKNKK